MKILLVNGVYEKGSTGNIVKTLYTNFKNAGEDTYVLYGRGNKNSDYHIVKRTFEFESKIHHFFSLISGNLYGGMLFSTTRIIKFIRKNKPDVVNVHCANGYFVNIYRLLSWLAKANIKTILTMHADFMMTGGCGIAGECNKHKTDQCKKCPFIHEFNRKFSLNRTNHFYNKMLKSVAKFDKKNLKITCVSPWLADRYSSSSIYSKFLVDSVINPVDDLFFTEPLKNPYISKQNILYVTPDITDKVKSGHFIDEIAKKRPDINFTIICTKNIDFEFASSNITYIKGGVSKDKLRDYYHYADGTILLSKRETFSLVVASLP